MGIDLGLHKREGMGMKNIYIFLTGVLGLLIFSPAQSLVAAPKKTEAELIQMLHSPDQKTILDALDRLPNWYPNSTNAIAAIKEIFRSKEIIINSSNTSPNVVVEKTGHRDKPMAANRPVAVPHEYLVRKAARALGNYHAMLDADDLDVIYGFLGARDPDVVMDGLKTLRDLPVPQTVPKILPLLKDENHNVVRDSCRTLAVLGDTNAIPLIEPLLKDYRLDVRRDAQDAINKLRAKP
jgi:hypothetical protein